MPDMPPDDPSQPEVSPEEKLAQLKQEHRALDDAIARLSEAGPINQLEIQRLKRRKLSLRDRIAKLESGRYPDIIA